MPIISGNNDDAPRLYIGSNAVTRVYLGANQVWQPAASGTISDFAGLATYAATAAADPTGTYDLSRVDQAALKASVGRNSSNPLIDPRVDPLPTGIVYSAANRTVTVNSSYAGQDVEDLYLEDLRLDIITPIRYVRNCVWRDTTPLNASDYSGNTAACLSIPNFANGEIQFIENNEYSRDRNMLQGKGMFFHTVRPRRPEIRHNRIDGLQGDFARPEKTSIVEYNWIEMRAFDDVVAFNSGLTYNSGDYAQNANGHLFVALADGITGSGQAPATNKSDNAFWRNLDPHSDVFQMLSSQDNGVDPATNIIRYNWASFEDRADGPFVKHFWTQLPGVDNTTPIYSYLIEGNVLYRPSGSNHEPISIPAGATDMGQMVIRGNWLAADRHGVYGDTDANTIPLWTNNRDFTTGSTTAVPTDYTSTIAQSIVGSASGTTITLTFDRTPVLVSGGSFTLRQGSSVIETFSSTDATRQGARTLTFTAAATVASSQSLRIAANTVTDVAGYPVAATTVSLSGAVSTRNAATIGQSEQVKGVFMNTFFTTNAGPYPAVASGVDVEIMIPAAANDGAATHGIFAVTQANATARNVSPGAVALANLWHLGAGGEALRLNGVVVSGTGLNDLLDDALPNRTWSTELQQVQDAEAAWGPTDSVNYIWWNNEKGPAKTLWESRSAHFFGINDDGSDYDFTNGDIEHCLIDTTGRGFGMFPATAVVNVAYPGLALQASTTSGGTTLFGTSDLFNPENINYTTKVFGNNGGRIDGMNFQNGPPAFAERRDFLVDAPAANRGVATISPGLCLFGDYENGVQKSGSAETGIHPAMQDQDGQILFSQHVAFHLLCSYGHATPTRLDRTEVASDGAYVDFIFSLPDDADLTTQRILNSETVSSPRPHQQAVMGFVIKRIGDNDRTARPVFRTDATSYPSAYRGTVTIHDAGSGGSGNREGIVRITPEEAFVDGDVVEFGMDGSGGSFILSGYPDYDAKLYRDGLRAYESRLDDGTQYRFPGAPVVAQESVTISGLVVTPPPSGGPRVARVEGADAWLQGPLVGNGVTELTMLFTGAIGVQSGFGRKRILSLSSQGLLLEIDTRSNQRQARMKVEGGTGTELFSTFYGANTVSAGDVDMTLLITATQDDGSGNARVATYLNGSRIGSVEVTTADVNAFFQTAQRLEALNSDVALEVVRVAMWSSYSADGSEPTSNQLVDLQGDAAFWNGSGLPAGWSKQGDDSFSDV